MFLKKLNSYCCYKCLDNRDAEVPVGMSVCNLTLCGTEFLWFPLLTGT